jgi:hypothetical protein
VRLTVRQKTPLIDRMSVPLSAVVAPPPPGAAAPASSASAAAAAAHKAKRRRAGDIALALPDAKEVPLPEGKAHGLSALDWAAILRFVDALAMLRVVPRVCKAWHALQLRPEPWWGVDAEPVRAVLNNEILVRWAQRFTQLRVLDLTEARVACGMVLRTDTCAGAVRSAVL